MIEVRNLTKKYGDLTALDNISFKIEQGKIYGLLGPNGAGKSTTMNIIAGCLAATGGSVSIDGHDIFEQPLEAKRHIGYLPEVPPLYTDMTPAEYLSFVAEAKGVDYELTLRQVREVIELTGLDEVEDRLIANLSKGYRQRVGIAQAMLGNPDLIILDEPTVGLDPRQIIEIRDLIRMLGEVKTVILSSHILAEVAEICERVIIINRGKIVADDTIENLKAADGEGGTLKISVRGDAGTVGRALEEIEGIEAIETLPPAEHGVCRLRLKIARGLDLRDAVFFGMADKKCAVISMEHEHSSLESIFMSLIDERPAGEEEGAADDVGDEEETE